MKRVLLLVLQIQMVSCSLTSLQKHATSLPEVPEVSYATFKLHPDYSLWHRQHMPSWFESLLSTIGLYRPAWSPKDFTDLLTHVNKQRVGLNPWLFFCFSTQKPHNQQFELNPTEGVSYFCFAILNTWTNTKLLEF